VGLDPSVLASPSPVAIDGRVLTPVVPVVSVLSPSLSLSSSSSSTLIHSGDSNSVASDVDIRSRIIDIQTAISGVLPKHIQPGLETIGVGDVGAYGLVEPNPTASVNDHYIVATVKTMIRHGMNDVMSTSQRNRCYPIGISTFEGPGVANVNDRIDVFHTIWRTEMIRRRFRLIPQGLTD
jgi:hypothetical protein